MISMKKITNPLPSHNLFKRILVFGSKFHIFTFLLLIGCICLCATLFTTQIIFPASSKKILVKDSPNTPQSAEPIIIIDSGHGGKDPGKVGAKGSLEKDINLKIALYLKEILENQKLQVIMTREEDKDLSTTSTNFKIFDMKERISLIQESNADLVVSIHQNSYSDPKVYGAQCFYYTDSEEGKELASIIQKQIITSTNQTKIREIKSNADYYLLKHSPLPTVIVECGFLSNPKEENLLLTEEYQRKIAWAIHLGILQYLNQNNDGF